VKIIATLILTLWCLAADAQVISSTWGGNVLVGAGAAAAGLTPPDLMSQDFEGGASAPSGWSQDTGANVVWNFTPALLGSGSVEAISASGADWSLGSTLAEVYVFFYFKPLTIPAGSSEMFHIWNPSGGSYPANEMLRITLQSTGSLLLGCKGTVNNGGTTSVMTANTLYYVWVHFKFVTSTTSIASVAFSTSLTEPTVGNNFVSTAAGTANFGAHDFTFGNGGTSSSINMVYDHIGIATFDMPSGW